MQLLFTISPTLNLIGGIFAAACMVIVLLAQAKLLQATGEKGWKVFIPFYGWYLFFKKTCDNGGLFIGLLICFAYAIILSLIVPVMGLYYMLLPLFCNFMMCINLAGAYEKGTGFAFGLLLCPAVFYSMLAFGSSTEAAPAAA